MEAYKQEFIEFFIVRCNRKYFVVRDLSHLFSLVLPLHTVGQGLIPLP